MQIEISTDSNIEGREELATHVKGVVESALNRFSSDVLGRSPLLAETL